MKKIIFVSILALSFFGFSTVFAQVKNTDVNLSVNPENPAPNQSVEAVVQSYVTDLSKAYIVWNINGRDVAQGVGKKSLSFNSGDIGNSTNITVTIELLNNEVLKKNVIVFTSLVDLLWEATDSYTPPFYPGKALGVEEGTYRVTAIPIVYVDKVRVSPNNLSYKWKKNGSPTTTSSGWGKSSYSFTSSFLDRNTEIEVTVSDIYENTVGIGRVMIPATKPKILFYPKNPETLTPWYERSLGTETTIDERGITLVAEPYFFSKQKYFDNTLNFRWFLGNQEVINVNDAKNELNVKGEEGKSGQARVRLILENSKRLFEKAEKSLNVLF